MSDAATVLRPARKSDAAALAHLIDIAGEGLPSHLWADAAAAGETPFDVGARRAEREEGGFSYRRAHVAEVDGTVAAMLLGYRQPDPYDAGDLASLPAVIRPLVELEALAPGSWYVNALAVLPAFHGRGLGSSLLALAEDLARSSAAPRLSIIVAGENDGAMALYRRTGYAVAGRRPLIGFPGCPYAGDWVLMTKAVGGASGGGLSSGA
ncbi:MAG: GNAT family N-acetyltransferase [Rhodospirillaceae bacterium]|nr:GNAT family N-acetyltransferase [Rhodospirillaceae bacterium]